MKFSNGFAVILLVMVCGGCATETELTCYQPEKIQDAVESEKIVIPEGLDDLRQDRELKIVKASPRDPRPADSPCLERPPRILSQGPSL
jgi:hypothetical protein